MTTHLVHGGALEAAVARFGGRREDWLDLSTGINPVPPALPALEADLFTRLPEAELEHEAREAARRLYGAPPSAGIVAAPGSQAIISLLPHLLEPVWELPGGGPARAFSSSGRRQTQSMPAASARIADKPGAEKNRRTDPAEFPNGLPAPGEAAILAPAYAEHARAFRAAGHAVSALADPASVPPSARVAVVVNPNNPDGRRFSRVTLLTLVDDLAARGGLLVVDEAFMDADPRESVSGDAGRPGLLVLRSFGKFFGLAGLRLGFALGEVELCARIAARLGPWSVSGPALAAGARLMCDAAGVDASRAGIARRSALTREALRDAGLAPGGDAALFSLVDVASAHGLFEALARRHILVRPFAEEPRWLRFGLVRDEGEAERLTAALREGLAEIGA